MAEPPIRSRPYSTAACCEKCVFDRGEHADFCELHSYLNPELERKLHRVILEGYADFEKMHLEI